MVLSWPEMNGYYNPNDVIHAAAMMVSVADQFTGNNNFEYDLVDIVRQGLSTFWGQPISFYFTFSNQGNLSSGASTSIVLGPRNFLPVSSFIVLWVTLLCVYVPLLRWELPDICRLA